MGITESKGRKAGWIEVADVLLEKGARVWFERAVHGSSDVEEEDERSSNWWVVLWDDSVIFGRGVVGVPSNGELPTTTGAWVEVKK